MTYRPADFRFSEGEMRRLVLIATLRRFWEAWEHENGWDQRFDLSTIYDQDEEG